MAALTAKLAKALDACIIENFADQFEMELELARIEKREDLDNPAVIAALATCADCAPVQKRLGNLPAAALHEGLGIALAGTLRSPAALLARALHDGAARSVNAKLALAVKGKKPLPAFANPDRLPAPVHAKTKQAMTRDELEAFVRILIAGGEPPTEDLTPASLAALGRALVLGWLAFGGDPKQRWAALGPAPFFDDGTARDLAGHAAELAPRVAMFSKAQVLVDALGVMASRVALGELLELATKLRTRSVKTRARAVFDAAARRMGIKEHDLADKLMPTTAASGDEAKVVKTTAKAFLKRLEQRMVESITFSLHDFIEDVLQHPIAHRAAANVLFAANARGKALLFTVVGDALEDVTGTIVAAPATAEISVVHPIELSTKQLAAWQRRLPEQPFAQLARPVLHLATVRALQRHLHGLRGRTTTARKLFGLEGLGWKRGATPGGRFNELARELRGATAMLTFEPCVYLVAGMSTDQRLEGVSIVGKKPQPLAFSEIARELAAL
ncbi:hypothetical protein BH11MYX1_BH11MYX1_19150 [soil metagenome]